MYGFNPLELLVVLAVAVLLFRNPPGPPWASRSDRVGRM